MTSNLDEAKLFALIRQIKIGKKSLMEITVNILKEVKENSTSIKQEKVIFTKNLVKSSFGN